MLKSSLAKLSLFFYPVAILWMGLGILYLQGKEVEPFVWQAGMFSVVLLAYGLLSLLLGYRGDQFLLP
ncbi:MAG TPA: hypothetical protein VFF14_04785, partial [Candidatus Deferrimicrobium sp.]|nr:hypothetical protein [Candidatus Deferrimicrobium sp.]